MSSLDENQMPHFSEPPKQLTIPPKFLTTEQAFHRLGRHHFEADWNLERVLAHENQTRSEKAPREGTISTIEEFAQVLKGEAMLSEDERHEAYKRFAADYEENSKELNEQVNRYRFAMKQLRSAVAGGVEVKGISAIGEIVSFKTDAWNGPEADKALASGAVSERNGYFVPFSLWERRDRLQVGRWLIFRKRHLDQFLKNEIPGRHPDLRSQLQQFENYLENLVLENFDNRISRKATLDGFKEKTGYRLTIKQTAESRREVLERLGATRWLKSGRPPKESK